MLFYFQPVIPPLLMLWLWARNVRCFEASQVCANPTPHGGKTAHNHTMQYNKSDHVYWLCALFRVSPPRWPLIYLSDGL